MMRPPQSRIANCLHILPFLLQLGFISLLLSVGCATGAGGRCHGEAAERFVDSVVRMESGTILAEDYRGDRMFTTCYLGNADGLKITTVYCGHRTPDALVYRRVYGQHGVFARTEAMSRDNPMTLHLEILDPNSGLPVPHGMITQGESKRYFESYRQGKGFVNRFPEEGDPEQP